MPNFEDHYHSVAGGDVRGVFYQTITSLSGLHLGKTDTRLNCGLLFSLGMFITAVRYLKYNDDSAVAERANMYFFFF